MNNLTPTLSTEEPPDQAKLRDLEAQYSRGFRIVYPDGFVLHGTQFPSGRCIVDDLVTGLIEAAVSLEALSQMQNPLARVHWSDDDAARLRSATAVVEAAKAWRAEQPWDDLREYDTETAALIAAIDAFHSSPPEGNTTS